MKEKNNKFYHVLAKALNHPIRFWAINVMYYKSW